MEQKLSIDTENQIKDINNIPFWYQDPNKLMAFGFKDEFTQ